MDSAIARTLSLYEDQVDYLDWLDIENGAEDDDDILMTYSTDQ